MKLADIRHENIANGGTWFTNTDPDPNIMPLEPVYSGPGGTYFISKESNRPPTSPGREKQTRYLVWSVDSEFNISPIREDPPHPEGADDGIPWSYMMFHEAQECAQELSVRTRYRLRNTAKDLAGSWYVYDRAEGREYHLKAGRRTADLVCDELNHPGSQAGEIRELADNIRGTS